MSGLLEGGSLTLNERGDVDPIPRHPNFRVFACMNPPTDIGKKVRFQTSLFFLPPFLMSSDFSRVICLTLYEQDLPPGIRNRFTELYVDELENPEDLKIIANAYLKEITHDPPVNDIVNFYLAAKKEAATSLSGML